MVYSEPKFIFAYSKNAKNLMMPANKIFNIFILTC